MSAFDHQTPVAGMPARSILRGAVISFQVERARLTGFFASRPTNSPWPGWASTSLEGERTDMSPLFDLICDFVPSPGNDASKPFSMLVTLIESYIVVNAGVLFLGFAGSRWTTTFAEKFLSYAVSVGVKLFVTYLIIGAGQHISDTWASTITTDMVVSDYLTILVGALVYMFLAWQIPSLASSMLTGAVSMTLGSAMATAGTMAR